MKFRSIFLLPLSLIASMVLSFLLLAPIFAIAQCSEEEMTAVFIVDGFYYDTNVAGSPGTFEGKLQPVAGEPDLPGLKGLELSRDTESFWQVDTFNCENLDSNTPDNHAWWCGAQFESCDPDDPVEGYGDSWVQWLGWHGSVPDPNEPVTVTVRARVNLDSEPGYDFIHLQFLGADGPIDVWALDGFAEGVIVEQTFTVQPEDYTDPFDTVHLRWTFKSDGGFSDEDCLFPSAGAAQIDLIEVFFDQGTGPVQIGDTETCEPGSDLQWVAEIDEMQLSLLDVDPLGEVSNPSIDEMIKAVEAVQPRTGYGYNNLAQAGPFHLFVDEPVNWGGFAIVDGRDNRVLFAGHTVRQGFGSVTYPVESSHLWSFPPGIPAAGPARVDILPNSRWHDQFGTPNEITDAVVDFLTGSDVLQSFSDCGDYEVVSFIYTPIWDQAEPQTASLIVIASGKCGPPWADFVSSAPPASADKWWTSVFPNPFNPQTTISFFHDQPQHVRVDVYDIRGHLIAELTDQQYGVGEHSVEWQGRDSAGRAVPSGEYFFRVEIGDRVETRKAMLLR